MTSSRILAAALLLTVASAAPVRAQDAGTPAGQKQPSAEEQAAMEKYMKAAALGPEHQKLAKLAGKWKAQVTAWMAPGAPPEKSDGSVEFKPILGDRYPTEEFTGSMGGHPVHGMGIMGYENVHNAR